MQEQNGGVPERTEGAPMEGRGVWWRKGRIQSGEKERGGGSEARAPGERERRREDGNMGISHVVAASGILEGFQLGILRVSGFWKLESGGLVLLEGCKMRAFFFSFVTSEEIVVGNIAGPCYYLTNSCISYHFCITYQSNHRFK